MFTNGKIMKYALCVLCFLVCCAKIINQPCYAGFRELPAPARCNDGLMFKTGWREHFINSYCELWTRENYIPEDVPMVNGDHDSFMNATGYYVPYTGNWYVRMYMCSGATSKIICTISQSTDSVRTVKSAYISSHSELKVYDAPMGGATGMFHAGTSVCYTIESEDNPFVAWGITGDKYVCTDAHQLPTTPADCYINYGEDLNVDMGIMERSKISATASQNSMYAKSRDVSILCIRDGSTALKIKFNYTPIDINGNNEVSTGISGLGIAIYYNGKPIRNGEELPVENFSTGENKRTLSFVPVRDKNVALKNMGTGDFSANAVMVMTEQ